MGQIDEIYKNLNSINNLNSEECIREILGNTLEEVVNYIKCDGAAIYLYSDDTGYLNPYIKSGCYERFICNVNEAYIDEKILNRIIHDNLIEEEILPIDVFISDNQIKPYIKYIHEEIMYLGIYKIVVDNKFIGMLVINYTDKPKDEYKSNEFVRFISKMIGIIIRGSKLNQTIKHINEKCKMVESQLDDYLDISADLFSVFDTYGNKIKMSSTWEKVLGWDIDELMKNKEIKYVHPEDISIVNEATKYLVKDGKVMNYSHQLIIRHLTKDNNYKWIRWSIKYSSNLKAFISMGKDITQEIREEEKKKNLEESIKLETMKNEFFSNISHEFKTPLNIILGTMQIMDKKVFESNMTKEDTTRYISSIKQNSYRLLRLVNNLIDISKIDVGCYNIHLSNNNIVNVIEDITLSVNQYAENKNIELIFDTDIEEVITACDPSAVERVILNLLSNAIKYMPSGGGRIEVSINYIVDRIIVSVKDNGVGIPKDKLDVIFSRFGQASTNLTRANEGSGIGLSLVQSIIEHHGGNIKVESVINEGSNFIFEIPIKIIDEKDDDYYIKSNDINMNNHMEKCNVEFSDIYNL